MIIEWNDSFISGISEIDEQHKEFIFNINKLSSDYDNTEELWAFILYIEDYIANHFQTEERYMKEFSFPEDMAFEHKQAHSKFIEDFTNIKIRLELENINIIKQDFITFLSEWLAEHYTNIDMILINHIKQNLKK